MRDFVTNPPVFRLLVAHEFRQNTAMRCPLRVGKRVFEFNPDLLDAMTDAELKRAFLTEELSLILGHPYMTAPEGCSSLAVSIGSALEVGGNYWVSDEKCSLLRPRQYVLPDGQTFEWYSKQIQSLLDEGLTIEYTGALVERVALWKEDKEAQALISGISFSSRNWESLTEKLANIIKARFKEKADWREMLGSFGRIRQVDLVSPESLLTTCDDIESIIGGYTIPQLNILNHEIYHFLSEYSGTEGRIWQQLSAYYAYLVNKRPIAAASFTDLYVSPSYYSKAVHRIARNTGNSFVGNMVTFVKGIK